MEVSALWKCPLYGSVRFMEVSALWKCPLYGSVRFIESWPFIIASFRYGNSTRSPLYRVHYTNKQTLNTIDDITNKHIVKLPWEDKQAELRLKMHTSLTAMVIGRS